MNFFFYAVSWFLLSVYRAILYFFFWSKSDKIKKQKKWKIMFDILY